jgi:hypothetical protein
MAGQTEIHRAVANARRQLVEAFTHNANDFFTEGDLAAFLVHRLHVELGEIGIKRVLAHLEYPTPFRCDMKNGGFCARTEEDRKPNGKRFQRGHFDVAVFNPAFVDECGTNYRLLKGQRWDLLRPVLERRDAKSEPVVLDVFELMYIRDPFWRDERHKRGKATFAAAMSYLIQDWTKLDHALKTSTNGFNFAARGSMLVFANGVGKTAVAAMKKSSTRLPRAARGDVPV